MRLLAVDETWANYYELEKKAQSRRRVGQSPQGQSSSRRMHLVTMIILGRKTCYNAGMFTKEKYNNCKHARPNENR